MDISFYVLLSLACMVLVLAMWACAAANTTKWGPDLTLELPPEVIRNALMQSLSVKSKGKVKEETMPSAPSELACDPLLSNAETMGISCPPPQASKFHPAFMNTVVRVLPTDFVPQHKVRPVFSTFSTEERA